MKKNKIIKLTSLAETRFLSLYDAHFENKDEEEKHWIIASRKDYDTLNAQYFEGGQEKVDAVVIAALHQETECLVMVRQFRIPLNDYVYELPAGLIDVRESAESTLSRELKEETGLQLLSVKENLSRDKVYLSAGMTEESAALVYCVCTGELSKDFLEPDEDIEPLLISQEKARELLKSDEKLDVKAYMCLQMFSMLGKKLFE